MVIIAQALFDEHTAIAELALGIVLQLPVNSPKSFYLGDLFNAHTAAAGRRLDENRRLLDTALFLAFKKLGSDFLRFHLVVNRCVRPRYGGNPQLIGHSFGIDLVAKIADHLPIRADEGEGPVAFRGPSGKTKILGEKTITGMDGSAAGVIGHGKDIIRFGIAGNPPGVLPEAARYILSYMFRILIGFGINNNIRQTEILAGIHNTYGYFAAIGDENLSFQSFPR